MDERVLPFEHKLDSQDAVLDLLDDWAYQVEFTPWDISDLPDRAQELIKAMNLVSHYEDVGGAFPGLSD